MKRTYSYICGRHNFTAHSPKLAKLRWWLHLFWTHGESGGPA